MKRSLLTIAVLSAVLFPTFGQTHPAKRAESLNSSGFIKGDSLTAETVLKENQPQGFNIPGLPRFAVFGHEGKFYLGLGGQIKATAGYDFGDVIDSPNSFTTSALPMNPSPGNGGKFQISGQQSSFFINFVALPGNPNQIGAYVGVNFINSGYAPNLTQAYLKYRGFTAGYTYTLFGDMAACPPTIDYEGPNAFTAFPHGVVYYERPFGKQKEWKVGVGLEEPNQSFTLASDTRMVTQRVPDIPAYIQYSWAKGSGWLRFSAIVRNMYYRNLLTDKNVDKVGWGVKLSGSTPVAGPLTAYYQAVYGKGIASYIQDLIGLGLDMVPSADNPSVLKTVKAWGAYGGLQYNFSPSVFASATYSQVRTYAGGYKGGSTPFGEQYKYAQYVVANVFWNINSLVQTGVEYIYGRKMDFNSRQSHDNRIQTMLVLSF